MNWENIETAPKDGTQILGFDPSLLGVVIACWNKTGWYVDQATQDGIGFENMTLTYWMPLPEAPKDGK